MSPSLTIFAPPRIKSRSVTSRMEKSSLTVAFCFPKSPAKSTPPLTCALVVSAYKGFVMPFFSVIGRKPLLLSITAPAPVSGAITSEKSRLFKLSSPVKVAFTPSPESAPTSSLNVVPEFPQSRVSPKKRSVAPRTKNLPSSKRISAPSFFKHSAMDSVSSAISGLSIVFSPSVSADRSRLLSVSDLSAGQENLPENGFAG